MVPTLVVAGTLFMSGVAVVGVVLVVLTLLLVAIDSWANRPIKKAAPRYDEDY